jgi:hypothetical protein
MFGKECEVVARRDAGKYNYALLKMNNEILYKIATCLPAGACEVEYSHVARFIKQKSVSFLQLTL